VFILGCGGGGDVIQAIPIVNYLRRLGVERFVLGDVAVKWWDRPGRIPLGCEVSDLDWYDPAERLHEFVVVVNQDTKLNSGLGSGQPLYEAEVARTTGIPTVAIGVLGGCRGFVDGCRAVMSHYDLELMVTVDVGADAFFREEETTVQSPLVDAFSLAAAVELDGIYALTGYACDAEIPMAHLERNVAEVMGRGGYLGAHGLTPSDVADLSAVLDLFPHETIANWPRDAARGRLGTHYCKGWWAIEVTPLAAVTMFFEPSVLAEINPIPRLISPTSSLSEAEDLILSATTLIPETRLPTLVEVPTGPQLPERQSERHR
jgi:hypothetical protein